MTIPIKTSNTKERKQLYLRHVEKTSIEKGRLKQAFTEKKISPFLTNAFPMRLIEDQYDRRLLVKRSAPSIHRKQGKLSSLATPLPITTNADQRSALVQDGSSMALKKPSLSNKKSQNLWLKTFLKDGGHMGHKPLKLPISRLWHPHIGNFIIGDRNMVALINSPLTLKQAIKGLYLSAAVLRRQGHILIIDTRGETSSLPGLVKSSNDKIPTTLSFSGSRWMGGSLTNWDSISIMVRRYAQISKQFDGFLAHNRIHIPRYEKMREAYPGFIKTSLCFKRRPDLLWLINPTENRHIIQEANRLNIPTIALVDSNTDLSNISISIPINTNTLFQSNKLITTLLTLSNSFSTNDRKSC